jgi:hypothetical protein
MVPKLCAEILDLVLVLEPILETSTILLTSTLKLVTEDVPPHTRVFSNVEDMVDQTRMTRVLKLMLDAQDHHIRDHHSTKLDQNSLLAVPLIPVTSGERVEMVHGDH